MPCRLPKAGIDTSIWGLSLNDAMRVLNGSGRILVALNGNNPPTVKQGSTFLVYKEDTYLTPTGVTTGNNVYPADTSITYPVSEAVFEPADRTFAFGDTNFPAAIGASKTYYLWCSGAQDTDETSQGKGTYGMDETAPTWDDEKMGWYNASGYRVIATVKSTSGSAIDTTSLVIMKDNLGTAIFRDEKSAGTVGGAATNGAWTKHLIATEKVNTIIGCSKSSDVVTLPAGTYKIRGWACFYTRNQALGAQVRLYNTSDNSAVIYGKSVYDAGYYSQTISNFEIVTTIAAEKNFELQYWYSGNNYTNTDALGNFVNATGAVEVYAELAIEKIA